MEFDKTFKEVLAQLVPAIIWGKILQPFSFKKYSRKQRKDMWLMFADELEKNMGVFRIDEELEMLWRNGSEIKKNRAIIPHPEQFVLRIAELDRMKKFARYHLRRLKKDFFNSSSLRFGFIHTGKKMTTFISIYGQCYVAKKGLSLGVIFHAFADPEFAETLTKYINEALERIAKARSREDTISYDRPFILYLKEAG